MAKVCGVPVEATEEMWLGLARDMMMWVDMSGRPTPRKLFDHLENLGREIPQWLRDEPEMQALDHVPSKGARVAIIYKAMLAARPPEADAALRAVVGALEEAMKRAKTMRHAAELQGPTEYQNDRKAAKVWEKALYHEGKRLEEILKPALALARAAGMGEE